VKATLYIHAERDRARLRYAAQTLLEGMGQPFELEVQPAVTRAAGLLLPGDVWVAEEQLREVFSAVSLHHEFADGRSQSPDDPSDLNDSNTAQKADRPWVDLLACSLFERLPAECQGRRSDGPSFRVIISHDVDWTTLLEPVIWLKLALRTLRMLRRECFSLGTVISPGVLVRNVESLLQYEVDQGIGAYYFMLSGPHSFWRGGSRYDIHWPTARRMASLIQEAGMVLGLHGSYRASDRDRYALEKRRLEGVAGREVTCHRNHYLRFDPRRTWRQLEAAGFQYDFTVGYRRGLGFRAGVGRVYSAFDLARERVCSLRLVPLLLMDSFAPLSDLRGLLCQLRRALLWVKQIGGCVSLLFHPELFLVTREYRTLFEESVSLCRDLGADLSGELPAQTA